jgi:hypothetical protein
MIIKKGFAGDTSTNKPSLKNCAVDLLNYFVVGAILQAWVGRWDASASRLRPNVPRLSPLLVAVATRQRPTAVVCNVKSKFHFVPFTFATAH